MKDMNSHPEPDIELTPAAEKRLSVRVASQGCAGIRMAVRPAGCSGLEYVMDYADAPEAGDYVRVYDGFALYVDAGSYEQALKGLKLDYQEDALSSGFVFINPNTKGECGCGASFTV
jgi:iron-sulfur cluster assembly protein